MDVLHFFCFPLNQDMLTGCSPFREKSRERVGAQDGAKGGGSQAPHLHSCLLRQAHILTQAAQIIFKMSFKGRSFCESLTLWL